MTETSHDTWRTRSLAALDAAAAAWQARDGAGSAQLDAASLPGSSLEVLGRKFTLDPPELRVVALLAAAEYRPSLRRELVAEVDGSPTVEWLADLVSARPGELFAATGTLRNARLVHLGPSPWFATAPVRLDEDVLQFLLGNLGLGSGLEARRVPALLAADESLEHDAVVEQLAARLRSGDRFVSVADGEPGSTLVLVSAAAGRAGLGTTMIDARSLPDEPRQLADLAAVWNRDSVLHDLVLLVDLTALSPVEPHWAVHHFLHRLHGPVVTVGRLPGLVHRPLTALSFPAGRGSAGSGEQLAARRALAERAQPMRRAVTLRDVVLPEPSRRHLQLLANRVRFADRVHREWAFGSATRSVGVSALFAGPSGTGKTMAAEALAAELDRELYRVDLAMTVSKYIGETERNLAAIFDAAERCDAILLFDEADALFGKRTEIRDSHDRYANIEVSFLLQRIERSTGVAILTSNIKSALDHAFARRLTVVVDFPAPGHTERAEIWRRAIPETAPTSGLDVEKLAQLSVTGASIHNIALSAAFAAAAAGQPIGMHHVADAAQLEYQKIGRQLTTAELRGWTP